MIVEKSKNYNFQISSTDNSARVGKVLTANGEFSTPAFMPVGTAGSVKSLTSNNIKDTGSEIILANTYHLILRPGSQLIESFGGLHKFMNWNAPILTDSGGYQVMSLSDLRTIKESGVTFRSHIDGSYTELTPENVIFAQEQIGSDISMILDACPPYPISKSEAGDAMRLSLRWAERCKEAWKHRSGYSLFGIVQGGVFPDLREESINNLIPMDFDGYAIGGLAVGEGSDLMLDILESTVPKLPYTAPRYLMGVGKPDQIIDAILKGVDMFDCVLPTRSGRNGQAFTRFGPINIKNSRFSKDPLPVDPECQCEACKFYSRAYIHNMMKSKEIVGAILLTKHNITFYQDMMSGIRESICLSTSDDWAAGFKKRYNRGLDG